MAEEPKEDRGGTSLGIVIAAFGSLVVSAVTMAPLGLVFLFGKQPPLRSAYYVIYWSLLILSIGFAILSERKALVRWIVLILAAISLLNLGGCVAVLGAMGRATSG